MVPPLASSKCPFLSPIAPVNEPFTWPKNSLEAISLGMAPQSTAINGLFRRSLFRWIDLATTSLPVPLSPIISTDISVGATKLMNLLKRLEAGLIPSI